MMSPPIAISASCTMPSLLTSTIDSSARIDLLPGRHPLRQLGELRADQQRVHVVLRQHRQRRRGEVEQEDEEQRPEHRLRAPPAPMASCSSASGCAAARRCRPSGRRSAPGSCAATTSRAASSLPGNASACRSGGAARAASAGLLRPRRLGRRDVLREGGERLLAASSSCSAPHSRPSPSRPPRLLRPCRVEGPGRPFSFAPATSARSLKMSRTSSLLRDP